MKQNARKPAKAKKPKTKFVKATEEERDRRIDEMVDFISNRPNVSRFKIYKHFTKRWHLTWRMVEIYITHAREELNKRLTRTPLQIRTNAEAFYESIINDPKQFIKVRLKAQQLLVELRGAAAPQRHEVSGPEGQPIQTQTQISTEGQKYIESLSVDEIKAAITKLEQMPHKTLEDKQ